jgi:hypothetical protein
MPETRHRYISQYVSVFFETDTGTDLAHALEIPIYFFQDPIVPVPVPQLSQNILLTPEPVQTGTKLFTGTSTGNTNLFLPRPYSTGIGTTYNYLRTYY